MKKILKWFTSAIIILFLLFPFNYKVYSQEVASTPTPTATPTPDNSGRLKELSEEISKLESQLSSTQKQAKTLSNEVTQMNSQIQLTSLQIEETKNKLVVLADDINNLIKKINRLENSLDEIAGILLNRVRETYIKGRINSLDLVFSSTGFADLLNKSKYLKAAQAHDKKLMYQIQTTKVNYEDQKKLLEEKKKEQERLKTQMENYQVTLNNQKKDKEQLLTVTRNDEKKYQEMLSKLNQQKQSLLSAVTASGGVSGDYKVWGNDDNYFNQADSRWANNLIGGSSTGNNPSYMWEYGCAVTSAAMVLSKMGTDIDPGRLSNNSIYFYDLIAWQKIPDVFPVSAVNNPYGSVNWETIDQNLSEGKWVIVHVWAFTASGHYVVLKNKEGDDYKIHDPYFGPNLMLSSRYSKSAIDQMIIYQKN